MSYFLSRRELRHVLARIVYDVQACARIVVEAATRIQARDNRRMDFVAIPDFPKWLAD
jgi:hypothetical protein